jgi:hypothetical protein
MISTDLGNLDIGIQSEPTDGVPNDVLQEALNKDIKNELEVCRLTCGDCPRGLNCQTLGSPDRKRGNNGGIYGDGSGFAFRDGPLPRPSNHFQALSFIEHCHRPLGLAARVGVNLFVKQEYMWGTPLVPLRAKLQVMGRMMEELEQELRRGHVAAERNLDSVSSTCFAAIDAIKKTASGQLDSELNQPFAVELTKKLFRDNCSQPAIAHAFRACCMRLPELLRTRWCAGEGWATYWAFASDCREAGLTITREYVRLSLNSQVGSLIKADKLQKQIEELAIELKKEK